MIEVLEYLRANGFKTFIVSGGGISMIRVFAEEASGIPPEQVVGSSVKTKFEMRNGEPVIIRLPALPRVRLLASGQFQTASNNDPPPGF